MLTKHQENKLGGNYTRMPHIISNKSQKQHPKKQLLYSHLIPISKTASVRRTRQRGNKDKLISNVLIWTPTHGHNSVGRPAKTYLYQLCADTACSLVDLLGTMDDQERENQGNPCFRHDLMITMTNLAVVCHTFTYLTTYIHSQNLACMTLRKFGYEYPTKK